MLERNARRPSLLFVLLSSIVSINSIIIGIVGDFKEIPRQQQWLAAAGAAAVVVLNNGGELLSSLRLLDSGWARRRCCSVLLLLVAAVTRVFRGVGCLGWEQQLLCSAGARLIEDFFFRPSGTGCY